MSDYRLIKLILLYICIPILSCSGDIQNQFEKRVSEVDQYFSAKPILLVSIKTKTDSEDTKASKKALADFGYSAEYIRGTYAYWGLKVENYVLSYNIGKRFFLWPANNGFIRISCNVLSNRGSDEFSTTDAALNNTDFSNKNNFTLLIKYSYKNGEWIYKSLEGYLEGYYWDESFVRCLKVLSQYSAFRKVIGM